MEWEGGRRAIANQNLHGLHMQKHGYLRDFKIIWSSLSLDNILESSGLREEEANVQPTKAKEDRQVKHKSAGCGTETKEHN